MPGGFRFYITNSQPELCFWWSSQKTPREDSNLRICLDVFFCFGFVCVDFFHSRPDSWVGGKGHFWAAPAKKIDLHGSTCNMDKHGICMAALHHKWLVRFLPSTVQDISELGYGHLPLHLGIPGANTSPWGWRSTLKGIHSLRHVLVQSFSLVYLDDGKYLGGGCWTIFVLYFAWFEAGIVSSRSRFVFHYINIYIYVLHSLSLRRL